MHYDSLLNNSIIFDNLNENLNFPLRNFLQLIGSFGNILIMQVLYINHIIRAQLEKRKKEKKRIYIYKIQALSPSLSLSLSLYIYI